MFGIRKQWGTASYTNIVILDKPFGNSVSVA